MRSLVAARLDVTLQYRFGGMARGALDVAATSPTHRDLVRPAKRTYVLLTVHRWDLRRPSLLGPG